MLPHVNASARRSPIVAGVVLASLARLVAIPLVQHTGRCVADWAARPQLLLPGSPATVAIVLIAARAPSGRRPR